MASEKELRDCFAATPLKIPEQQSTFVGSLEGNESKNRYNDTLPYDFNRVCIMDSCRSKIWGLNTLVASYFNGSYFDDDFIATQGPLPNTVGDFYQVIWEQNVKLVVQLTQCEYANENNPNELKRKSHPYWTEEVDAPVHISELRGRDSKGQVMKVETPPRGKFPDFRLTKTREFRVEDLIVRNIRIEDGRGQIKEFTHLHFEGWPNGGVPSNKQAVIDFASLVVTMTNKIKSATPWRTRVMAHCSGGVGRTGSFLILTRMVRANGEGLDPLELLTSSRKRRMMIVDNADQFVWLHELAGMFKEGKLKVRSVAEGLYKGMAQEGLV